MIENSFAFCKILTVSANCHYDYNLCYQAGNKTFNYQSIKIDLQITHNYKKFSHETMSEKNPVTYLDYIYRISLFFGLYAMYLLYNVCT